MPHYRIYLIGPDNRIQSGHDAECDTDLQAKRTALTIKGRGASAEIWQSTRIVDRVPAGIPTERD